MAIAVLCRCEIHAPSSKKLHRYTHRAEPMGFPDTSSICGRWQIGCQNPGYIYMTDDAVDAFKKGKRIFRYATNVSQVQLKDNSTKKIIMDSKLLK